MKNGKVSGQTRDEAPHANQVRKKRRGKINHTSRIRNRTTGLSAEHPPVTQDKCPSAQINQVIVKNMQEVNDTSTMKCQNMEEVEVPRSQCLEGLGIVMKDNDSADTGLA